MDCSSILSALIGAAIGGIISWIFYRKEHALVRRMEAVKVATELLATARQFGGVELAGTSEYAVYVPLTRVQSSQFLHETKDQNVVYAAMAKERKRKELRLALDAVANSLWRLSMDPSSGGNTWELLKALTDDMLNSEPDQLAPRVRELERRWEPCVEIAYRRVSRELDLPPETPENTHVAEIVEVEDDSPLPAEDQEERGGLFGWAKRLKKERQDKHDGHNAE